MFFLLIYIAAFFCGFLLLVNSSKIYRLLFSLVLIDSTSLLIIELLPCQFKMYILFLPLTILVILFFFTSFLIGGIHSVLEYIFRVFSGHQYCVLKLQSLFLIWGPFKNYSYNGCKSLLSCLKLFVALHIIFISLLKELSKKYYVLLFLYWFVTKTLLVFFVYLSHILCFIILVSLLGIDSKVVNFLASFFGNSCLGLIGSYQILEHDGKKIKFLDPDEYVVNKK